MKPVMVTLPAFHVVGLEGTYSPATTSQIPELWGRLAPQLEAIPGRKGWVTYGLCTPNVPGPDGKPVFRYVAAVEVGEPGHAPLGMVEFTVPAQTYARFTHEGHISEIGKTIDSIWNTWIPESGLEPTHGFEFERYDDRWDEATCVGPVDVYVPVKA